MTNPRERPARLENVRLVVRMQSLLDEFIAGTLDRRELSLLALAEYRRAGPQGPPHLWGAARAILDSLVAELPEDASESAGKAADHVVRVSDIQAYARWLRQGEPQLRDEQPLALLRIGDDEFFDLVRVEPVRWWYSGIGWTWSVEFCSPGSGRTFGAMGLVERGPRTRGIDIRKAAHDRDSEGALADLLETLGVQADMVETSVDVEVVRRLSRF